MKTQQRLKLPQSRWVLNNHSAVSVSSHSEENVRKLYPGGGLFYTVLHIVSCVFVITQQIQEMSTVIIVRINHDRLIKFFFIMLKVFSSDSDCLTVQYYRHSNAPINKYMNMKLKYWFKYINYLTAQLANQNQVSQRALVFCHDLAVLQNVNLHIHCNDP